MNQEIKLGDDEYIVSKTDLKGNITYANEIFVKISGYNVEELDGQPHNILRHPDMPKVVFKLLWDRVKAKQEILAFVKNKCKNGDYYWVFANVTPTIVDGRIVDYHSVRRKPNPRAIQEVEKLYSTLLSIENGRSVGNGTGLGGAEAYLNKLLQEKGVSYDKFISDLQG